jgi:peptide/nickel transport system substrate-binding protein
MRYTWFLAAIPVMAVLLAAGGCGCRVESTSNVPKQSDGKAKEDSAAENSANKSSRPALSRGGKPPAENDVLLTYYGDDPDTLNLITSNDTVSTAFQRYVYEALADRKPSNPDEWEPALAESWEFDKDTLTFTIHLRKGVYWHPMKLPSGKELPKTEFTSADVKFTYDCILNENIDAASLRSYYTNPNAKDDTEKYKIKVTVVDKYTVKIQWSEPYFLADEFTLANPIMPRHVYGMDQNGEPISLDFRNSKEFADAFNNHWANTKMCGTGPLIFEEWKKENSSTLVRNDDYWGEPFYFSRVIYRYVSNPQTALQQVLQNELDWGAIPEKDHFIQNQESSTVKSGKVKLVAYDYPGYRYMGFNVKRDLFSDKRVRTAVSYAVPVNDIVDKVYHGLAKRLSGPFLPGSTANDESLEPLPYDLDKANKLLDEAGWKDTDGNGIRDKTIAGRKVEATFDLMIYGESPQYQRIAEIIGENCRRIGMECRITPTQWALMLQNLRKKEFDVTILGWALSWKNDPFQIFHGSQADLPESSNSIGYQNPELDKLIEELRVTLDEKKQTELYHKIHKIIYDDQPYTFLFMDKATAGHDARLENIQYYKIRPGVDLRDWTSSHARTLAP